MHLLCSESTSLMAVRPELDGRSTLEQGQTQIKQEEDQLTRNQRYSRISQKRYQKDRRPNLKLERDVFMSDRSLQEPSRCWTQPISMKEIKQKGSTAISLDPLDSGYIVCEHRGESLFDMAEVETDFLCDLIQYLPLKIVGT